MIRSIALLSLVTALTVGPVALVVAASSAKPSTRTAAAGTVHMT